MSPDASPASRHARSVEATRDGRLPAFRPEDFRQIFDGRGAELVPPLRLAARRPTESEANVSGSETAAASPECERINAEQALDDLDQVGDPLVGHDVFAGREQRKHSLETEDIPGIRQCPAADTAIEMVLDFRQQPFDFKHFAPLQAAMS